MLLCSHLLADVEDVCDRVTILYGGKIRAQGTVGELLTVSDSLLFETDALAAGTVEKVRLLISSEEQKQVRKVEAPRKKLETLFLEIVQQAQREGVRTSGARDGGAVAEFLAANPAAEDSGQNLIARLSAANEPPPLSAPAPASAPPTAGPDAAVLQALTPTEAPAPTAAEQKAEVTPAQTPKPVDRSVIDRLLGPGGTP